MIPVPGTGEVGRSIADHHICIPAQGLLHQIYGALPGYVRLESFHAGDGRDALQVHAHDFAPRKLGRHLQPAAGRSTQVNHAVPSLDNVKLLIYLQQLIGGAGSITLLLCQTVVVISLISGHCLNKIAEG